MYFSYILAVSVILVLFLALILLLPGRPVMRLLLIASLLFVPFVPAVFRYSRILWIHLDRHFEP
jgi:hypothetical protein